MHYPSSRFIHSFLSLESESLIIGSIKCPTVCRLLSPEVSQGRLNQTEIG